MTPDDMLLEQRSAISIMVVECDRLRARNEKLEKLVKLVKEHIAWSDDFDSASLIPVELRIAMAELEQP